MGGGDASVDQAVEFGGVFAGDLVHDFGREAGELLLDVFRGFWPDAEPHIIVSTPISSISSALIVSNCKVVLHLSRKRSANSKSMWCNA